MEQYRELVAEINNLNTKAKQIVKRCQYLKRKGDANKKINPEQAEAYYERLNLWKPRLCDLVESIEVREEKLKTMPREWIV